MVGVRRWRRWRRLLSLLAGTSALLALLFVAPAASGAPAVRPSPAASPSPAAAIPTTTKCQGYSWFNGVHWCPANALGVAQTWYGVGRRVWLGGVVVNQVSTDTVVVSQYVPCPAGHFCGASDGSKRSDGYNSWNSLTLRWSGSHRPKVNDIVRLYGSTTSGSLTPAGYVWTGTYVPCPDPVIGC